MSVKHGLLALLGERPRHGYQLKLSFEARTGGTWPLNIGQVYTTLQRLERDGLVRSGPPGEDGTVTYDLTPRGTDELTQWWLTPVERQPPARDEVAIKLALAVTTPGIDANAILQRQRTATVRTLQQLTPLKAGPVRERTDGLIDVAWDLVLDRLIFDADAEARWLDHVERTLGGPVTSVGAAVEATDTAGTTVIEGVSTS